MTKMCKMGGMPPQKTGLAPFKWTYGDKELFWSVYYVSGKWRRIKVKTFKTERGAYRFYNALPLVK